MAKTIYIERPDGTTSNTVIFKTRDFLNVIREELGEDARRFIAEIVEEKDDAAQRVIELEEECDPETAYQQGYDAGYNDGYDDGLRDGERSKDDE